MSIEYDKIVSVGKDELVKKIRSGEIVVPIKGQERDDFLKFATLDPDSEDRKKFVQPKQPDPAPAPAQETVAQVSPEQPVEPKPMESASIADDWVGHESKEKLIESYKQLRVAAQKQKEIIDRHSAEGGKAGRELKEAKARLAQLEAEMSARTEQPRERPVTPTSRPKPPDPEQFSEGLLDDGYNKALRQYWNDLDKYNAAKDEEIQSLRAEISTIKPIVEEAKTVAETVKQNDKASLQEKQWSDLWIVDIPKFQDEFKLKTSVPVKEISDAWRTQGDPNAPADQRAAAAAFIKSIPDADLKAYDKIKQAVDVKYDFSTGLPMSRYKTFRGALIENDLLESYNVLNPINPAPADTKAALDRKLAQDADSASVLSGSSLGRNDNKMSEMKPIAEEQKELRDLVLTWKGTPSGKMDEFANTQSFKRMVKLGQKFGYKWPKSKHFDQALIT